MHLGFIPVGEPLLQANVQDGANRLLMESIVAQWQWRISEHSHRFVDV